MNFEVSEDAIDRAARYLREITQASKGTKLLAWNDLPNGPKKKWLDVARRTLEAAVAGGEQSLTDAIDRAAQFLRESSQGAKPFAILPWGELGNSPKKKWILRAEGTLNAAWPEPSNSMRPK